MVPESARAYLHEPPNLTLRAYPEAEGRITHARRIVSFRNRLIHGYATVADEVVWGVREGYLPRLKAEVEGLLAECGRE
ncbi:MAG: DUF86 domain-containing protein [Proteobacteria bacterium]|nr:DUF86 domain-containing protein [Pseudomonadota bacterium]